MSRNSKQVKKANIAKQFTKIRQGGNKGPAKTVSKHGKVATYNATKRAKNKTASREAVDLTAAFAGDDQS
jgi:hypothetical protein